MIDVTRVGTNYGNESRRAQTLTQTQERVAGAVKAQEGMMSQLMGGTLNKGGYGRSPTAQEVYAGVGFSVPNVSYNEVAAKDYGERPDGTKKGSGWLGELPVAGGGVATEYTMQSEAIKKDGKMIDFPTLVPTLTKEEVATMTQDIIPNRKEIPEEIIQKAIDHAKMRLKQGKSVFK
jgi:hypothetical protein